MSRLTRKHFQALAATVAAIADLGERRRSAYRLADLCAASNPRFHRAMFLHACNIEVAS